MKIERLPSGTYRVRKRIDGHAYSLTFDRKPTLDEINDKLHTLMNKDGLNGRQTMSEAVTEYINSRSNVLSPSTLRSYHTLQRSMSDAFGKKLIADVKSKDVQAEINRFAKNHSAKTTRNYHGFVTAVIRAFDPSRVFYTTLPQKRPSEAIRASESDIRALLEASKGSKYHVAFSLGVLGMRRGEICGLNIFTDLRGNELHIHQALVESDHGWMLKDVPKNDTSNRTIYLPDDLVAEILRQGFIVDVTPPMLVKALHSYQEQLGLPAFRFHDLRHYFATYAHALGVPDKYIMELGGWKTTHTLDKVYKETLDEKVKAEKVLLAKKIL